MATSDLRKAAVLLMSLPDRQAAQLLGKLAPEQAAAVFVAMAGIDRLDHDEQEAAMREFAAVVGRTSPSQRRHDGMARVVKMLNAMRPPAERRLLGEIAQAAPDLLGEIRRAIFGADVAACDQHSAADAA